MRQVWIQCFTEFSFVRCNVADQQVSLQEDCEVRLALGALRAGKVTHNAVD